MRPVKTRAGPASRGNIGVAKCTARATVSRQSKRGQTGAMRRSEHARPFRPSHLQSATNVTVSRATLKLTSARTPRSIGLPKAANAGHDDSVRVPHILVKDKGVLASISAHYLTTITLAQLIERILCPVVQPILADEIFQVVLPLLCCLTTPANRSRSLASLYRTRSSGSHGNLLRPCSPTRARRH